ncbi:MAG: PH domain-containing protein, partial [Acidobacteriota bacterium]
APWSTLLKVVSAVSVVVLFATVEVVAMVMPLQVIGTWPVWLVAGAMTLTLAGAALYTVRGYTLTGSELQVQRLLWSTVVSLEGLSKAWADPKAMSGSIRLFGNGGLFSFTGLYRNRKLGSYRAFATDLKRCVVLELLPRTVVVTPEDPQAFLAELARHSPTVRSPGVPTEPR